ncbi:hypothetical protein BJ322DRAFT_1094457 [Thelephora terrestris]|uniref:Uncharacterized protein n=1 Tax=Thelephora terrestris TaxID=56493 RepID=A0A9P6H4T3_9AGAM|nr:hypothetical protein BJ322DRAFT_1094457 [Thelephora terrestris]
MTIPREYPSMSTGYLDGSIEPPSFDSLHAPNAYPSSSSSLYPSPTTPGPSISDSVTSLPGYSASLPVPDYHPNPTGDEQRLEFVPTRSLYGRPTGVWTNKIKDMTISLQNQDPIEVQPAPRYGRRDIISGTITFDEENLTAFEKVKLVIEGETAVGNQPYEGRSEIFVRKTFTLWQKSAGQHVQCPRVINFQIPFSAVESRRSGMEVLPPSYVFDAGQGGRIACSYSIHINVTQRSRHAFWHNRNRHVIPINYVPRSRPPHEFPRDLGFPRSAIKALPEAWSQIMTAQGAISCNLFIPAVSAFCVTDEIPFFLQFVAPAGYFDLTEGEEPTLQVSLRRQVGLSIQETSLWRDMTSSQGFVKLLSSATHSRSTLDVPTPGPPALTSKSSSESILSRGFRRHRIAKRDEIVENGKLKTWEWKGTVCNNGVKVGGCTTDVMVINDFFEFSVRIKKANGQVLEYHHSQPINMVTEA